MGSNSKTSGVLLMLTVGLSAWLVPGAGHWILKERRRAVIIFVSIVALFGLGIYIASVGVIDPVDATAWYAAQILTSPGVAILGYLTRTRGYESFAKPNEIGQVYTCIAGMLNLLCIVNAVYIADLKTASGGE